MLEHRIEVCLERKGNGRKGKGNRRARGRTVRGPKLYEMLMTPFMGSVGACGGTICLTR